MKVPLRALSPRGQRTESCCQIDGFSPNVSPAEGRRVRLLCAIRHFLFLSFSYADRKGRGRGNGGETRRERSPPGPAAGSGTKLWSGQTARVVRRAVPLADPVRHGAAMPVISRTRATGPERNDPSRDEAGSSAAIKKARHLSRTCVLLADSRTFPNPLYFLFFLLIRPVPHQSRVLWFSPGNVYLRQNGYSLGSRRYLQMWDEILHRKECMLFHGIRSNARAVLKSSSESSIFQLSSSLYEFHFPSAAYITSCQFLLS